MTYEKHTWETGETITAEKLNNLEDGVASGRSGSGSLKVTMTKDENDNYHLDKSWREIKDAYDSGSYVWVNDRAFTEEEGYITYYTPMFITLIGYNEFFQTYIVSVNGSMFSSTSPDEWISPEPIPVPIGDSSDR